MRDRRSLLSRPVAYLRFGPKASQMYRRVNCKLPSLRAYARTRSRQFRRSGTYGSTSREPLAMPPRKRQRGNGSKCSTTRDKLAQIFQIETLRESNRRRGAPLERLAVWTISETAIRSLCNGRESASSRHMSTGERFSRTNTCYLLAKCAGCLKSARRRKVLNTCYQRLMHSLHKQAHRIRPSKRFGMSYHSSGT